MHNLIKSRAVFEILKKPLPERLQFKSDSNTESDDEDNDVDATTENTLNAVATQTTDSTEMIVKLNVNANEFVPRTTGVSENNKDLHVNELDFQFEMLEERKSNQPKLFLPWRGFPKPIRAERPVTKMLPIKEEKPQEHEELKSVTRVKSKKPLSPENRRKIVKESKTIVKSPVADEKRREQERKVALEALKLVEQRRQREQLEEKPDIIVHLTRSPVEFSPEERIRVDRLRIIKREHIEHVLREMRNEMELKRQTDAGCLQPVLSGRYISLPRLTKCQSSTEPQQAIVTELPKRYIPTVKQWDERCKARATHAACIANKENNASDAAVVATKSEDSLSMPRAMGTSSVVNVLSPTADKQEQNSAKERDLFVPRYWPPTPLTASGETRRGNLTHARNILRAFPNCGLLPLPYSIENETLKALSALPVEDNSVKRYAIEELLKLEPQPHELEQPLIDETYYKFGFITE